MKNDPLEPQTALDVIGGATCQAKGNGGGAVYCTGVNSAMRVVDTNISKGIAISSTATYIDGGTLEFIRCRFEQNVACTWGAGVRSNGGSVRIIGSVFLGNVVDRSGGACQLISTPTALVEIIDT
eukprot:1999595-Prymnesium_polylepis.1